MSSTEATAATRETTRAPRHKPAASSITVAQELSALDLAEALLLQRAAAHDASAAILCRLVARAHDCAARVA